MRGPDPSWSVALDSDTLSVSFTLLAGLDINQLDGWDVTKLGWMKASGKDEVVTSSLEQLATSFSPQVHAQYLALIIFNLKLKFCAKTSSDILY